MLRIFRVIYWQIKKIENRENMENCWMEGIKEFRLILKSCYGKVVRF